MYTSKGNTANNRKGDFMNKSTEQALATMFSVGSFTAKKSNKNEMKAVAELSDKFAAWTSLDECGSHLTIHLKMTEWAKNRIKIKD